ncbi:MAG TPA: diguanylate cyclase [Blastocatellia bacterium]|nr:diguanylate cyclase [Blastocatellia bacterium]
MNPHGFLPALSKETSRKTKSAKADARPQNSLAQWLRLQRSLAEKNQIALATLGRDSLVVGRVENDNSICQAMRRSAEHAHLCEEDCTNAFGRAVKAGCAIEYRCHAGLSCFAAPVSIDKKQLVILGGRAFTASSEYADFVNRYGHLATIRTGEALKNVKFIAGRDLGEAASLVASAAEYHFQATASDSGSPAIDPEAPKELLDAHLEIIRLTDQLESKNRSMSQFYEFLRGINSTLDSQKVYPSVLAKLSEMLRSERTSLMLLNESSNELAVEAALPEMADPVRVKLGEGIAGSVLAEGLPLVVRDAEADSRVPNVRRGQYKSNSFISYPISVGSRKIGVLNLADRVDGMPYESEDLSLLDLMVPHLALIIDSTEWHKKAEVYQRMSLTDPLTGLPNRRYLEDRLFEEVERSKRHGTPLAFMIIDVDRFKTYNDVYGHANADRVLVKTAQLLRQSVRAIDMSARFAGDEFCIVLPETDLAAAGKIADRLRKTVSETEYRSEQDEHMGRVTISIGVSSFSPTRQSPHSIMETADRALYQAKTRGRDCVAVYEDALTAE